MYGTLKITKLKQFPVEVKILLSPLYYFTTGIALRKFRTTGKNKSNLILSSLFGTETTFRKLFLFQEWTITVWIGLSFFSLYSVVFVGLRLNKELLEFADICSVLRLPPTVDSLMRYDSRPLCYKNLFVSRFVSTAVFTPPTASWLSSDVSAILCSTNHHPAAFAWEYPVTR